MEDNQIFLQLAANLVEASARNTASYITDKVKTIKAKQDDKETIVELEEIISNLLNDKMEIQRIAQSYEQELLAQKITEKDIEYITDNLLPILSHLIPDDKSININQLKSILSVETLTIMQLLGFNYKKAIGEPLTLLVKKSIEAKVPAEPSLNNKLTLTLATIAQDKEATKRFYNLLGRKYNDE